jgi:8-oxo-dGTP diphosphatase
MDAGIAVKGFILKDNEVLLVKREENDVNSPGVWEVPGGRIDPGENPIQALQREVKEETGLGICVGQPFAVESFVRDDGQQIVMIHFICEMEKGELALSHEHTEFEWVEKGKVIEKISPYFKYATTEFNKLK